MAKTVLVSCNCKSSFQDEKYGVGKRLANAKYLKNVEKGVFGADMKVELLNDGPVTILYDSEVWRKNK